jgi:hypothetical protein
MKMARLISQWGPNLTLLALPVLSFFWPLFTAKFWISIVAEDCLFLFSVVCAVFATVLLFRCRHEQSRKSWFKRATVAAGGVMSVLLIFTLWHLNNDLFFYWFLQTRSNGDWQEVSKEARSLGARALRRTSGNSYQLSFNDIPPAVNRVVGRRSEYSYAFVTRRTDSTIEVGIAYGYKGRRWGIFEGPDVKVRWPHAKTKNVLGGLYYFVTTDY